MTGIEVHLPTPYEGDDPQAEAHAITEASGTSFSGGMNILPTDRRNAMHAIYAFSRQVDDIADGPWSSEDKHKALDAWRAEIEALYAGAPSSAVGKALAPAIVAYELKTEKVPVCLFLESYKVMIAFSIAYSALLFSGIF